jgi:hypothetical protein
MIASLATSQNWKKKGYKLIFICVLVPFTHVLFDCNNVSFISTCFGSCLFRSNVQSPNEYELKRYFLRKVEKKARVKQQTNVLRLEQART